jgi:NADH:ubiquinone oxidoreductase subunit 4 (subunit M)
MVYSLRLYQGVFLGRRPGPEGEPEPEELSARELFVLSILGAGVLLLGVAPGPVLDAALGVGP